MAKTSGIRECSNCTMNYSWEFIIPRKSTEKLCVEYYEEFTTHPIPLSPISNDGKYTLRARCPHCDVIEYFECYFMD